MDSPGLTWTAEKRESSHLHSSVAWRSTARIHHVRPLSGFQGQLSIRPGDLDHDHHQIRTHESYPYWMSASSSEGDGRERQRERRGEKRKRREKEREREREIKQSSDGIEQEVE